MTIVTYLAHELITDVRITATPRNPSKTGYGGRIPLCYMVRIGTRWHRVYVMQYANAGSVYVRINGKPRFLSLTTQHTLEDSLP